jgi:hypothetical protein
MCICKLADYCEHSFSSVIGNDAIFVALSELIFVLIARLGTVLQRRLGLTRFFSALGIRMDPRPRSRSRVHLENAFQAGICIIYPYSLRRDRSASHERKRELLHT